MVTQYACNKPASLPFNVKPSVAKKDYMPQKHEIYGIFLQFFESFAENFMKNILQEMNLEWI